MSNQPQQHSEDSNRNTTSVHKKPCSIALTKHLAKRVAKNLAERTHKVHQVYYCDQHNAYHVEEA